MKRHCLSQGDISAILKSKFDITPSVQVLRDKDTGIVRYEIEHVPASRKMSVGGLKRYCKRICDALDADIGGTVNIEFISLGDDWTFDILAEARWPSNKHEDYPPITVEFKQ